MLRKSIWMMGPPSTNRPTAQGMPMAMESLRPRPAKWCIPSRSLLARAPEMAGTMDMARAVVREAGRLIRERTLVERATYRWLTAASSIYRPMQAKIIFTSSMLVMGMMDAPRVMGMAIRRSSGITGLSSAGVRLASIGMYSSRFRMRKAMTTRRATNSDTVMPRSSPAAPYSGPRDIQRAASMSPTTHLITCSVSWDRPVPVICWAPCRYPR